LNTTKKNMIKTYSQKFLKPIEYAIFSLFLKREILNHHKYFKSIELWFLWDGDGGEELEWGE